MEKRWVSRKVSRYAWAVLVCCALVAGIITRSMAEPNSSAVKWARAVVPDYSSTKGGASPALSPDGKTIAFVADRKTWILHAPDGFSPDGTIPEPWTLEFESPGYFPYNGSYVEGGWQILDWSPDGRRLAFVSADGRLYIAEDFDYSAKKASVRLLASPRVFKSDKLGATIICPKWSRDGSKVAFFRPRPPGQSVVSVIDVNSGVETILAWDGVDGWSQPWSPDGQYIAYTYGETVKQADYSRWARHGIAIVSIDGKQVRYITKGETDSWPSWSSDPTGLAFGGREDYGYKTRDGESRKSWGGAILATDVTGVPRRVLSSAKPTPEERTAQEAAARKRLGESFLAEYGPRLTPDETRKLSEGKMTPDDMVAVALRFSLKGFPPEFRRKMEAAMKLPDKQAQVAMAKSLKTLSTADQRRFLGIWLKFVLDADTFDSGTQGSEKPAWSADGHRIAFLRGLPWQTQDLCVEEMPSVKRTPVFSGRNISCVTWSADGTRLAFQASRLTGVTHEGGSISIGTSQPEVWVLELK